MKSAENILWQAMLAKRMVQEIPDDKADPVHSDVQGSGKWTGMWSKWSFPSGPVHFVECCEGRCTGRMFQAEETDMQI